MAKSNARKRRDHQKRNTGKDVTRWRAEQPSFNIVTRKTRSKQESIQKTSRQEKQRYSQYSNENDSVFLFF